MNERSVRHPIPATHCDFMGLRGLVLDLKPELMPEGAQLLIFDPGGLHKRADYHLPTGSMVMVIDGDVSDKLRPVLHSARIQAEDELRRRNERFKNGSGE